MGGKRPRPHEHHLRTQPAATREPTGGPRDYDSSLTFTRRSRTNSMGSAERLALGELITASVVKPAVLIAPTGPVIKAWTLADFDFGSAAAHGASTARGRELFRS